MSTPYEPGNTPRVGQQLSEARIAAGLSLTDVERQLRIPRRFLQAMEADRFDLLPAPVYARGFLRNYARFLGLDESEILLGFNLGNTPPKVLPVIPRKRNAGWLLMVAGLAFGLGLLLWAILGLKVFNAVGDLIDDIGGESPSPTPIIVTPTPTLTCDDLAGRESLSVEEQQWFETNCATPTPETPTEVPFRTDCDEIRGTDYESADEREYFLANCLTPPAG